ncbi:hypothetical protein IWQ61_007633 [Dispira simplex]|nr:hypothetical protein IWQ61_007633 [Dispira simplex]
MSQSTNSNVGGNLSATAMENLLNTFIHDYFKKKNYGQAAAALRAEAKLNNDVEAPISVPDSFLYEWWFVFWELFTSNSNANANPLARSFLELQKQHNQANQQVRHSQMQRHLAMQRTLSLNNAGATPNLLGARTALSQGAAQLANAGKHPAPGVPVPVPNNGRATPTPSAPAGSRAGSMVSPALPNGTIVGNPEDGGQNPAAMPGMVGMTNMGTAQTGVTNIHGNMVNNGNNPQHAMGNQHFMVNLPGMFPAQMRGMIGMSANPGFSTVAQNMADAGMANRDPITLNNQEKSFLLNQMKPNASQGTPAQGKMAGNDANSSSTPSTKKSGQGEKTPRIGNKKVNQSATANTPGSDAGSLPDQDAKRRRSNTSAKFSPTNNAADHAGMAGATNQALLSSSTPIMSVSSAGNPQMQNFSAQMQMMAAAQQRSMANQRAMTTGQLMNPTMSYPAQMQSMLTGGPNNPILANMTSQELPMQQTQRVQQIKVHSQFPQLQQQGQNIMMMNGQQILVSQGQGVMSPAPSMGLSQVTMGTSQMSFSAQPNGPGYQVTVTPNTVASSMVGSAGNTPTPVTSAPTGGSKKRKATPQLSAKAKANMDSNALSKSMAGNPVTLDANTPGGNPLSLLNSNNGNNNSNGGNTNSTSGLASSLNAAVASSAQAGPATDATVDNKGMLPDESSGGLNKHGNTSLSTSQGNVATTTTTSGLELDHNAFLNSNFDLNSLDINALLGDNMNPELFDGSNSLFPLPDNASIDFSFNDAQDFQNFINHS